MAERRTGGAPRRVVIVGSGPAGVSAAWPLVERGIEVTMLDAGGVGLPASPGGTIGALRRDENRARLTLGEPVPLPGSVAARSPKLATRLARAVTAGWAESLGVRMAGFFATGSLASGGLSAIWGAAAPEFLASDLARFPCGAAAMQEASARVAARIGVGGGVDALSAPVARVLRRHEALAADGLSLARARNAVLAAPRDGRGECVQCGLCLWGCARGSIYASAGELPALRRHSNFRHVSGRLVRGVEPAGDGHAVVAEDGARVEADAVILAAGAVASTALALRRLGAAGEPVRLFSNPVAALAFMVPGLFGAALPENSFGLGQLQYRLAVEAATAGGMLYAADTLPLGSFADRLPFSRPLALRFARALAPSLVLATIYLPGEYSRNFVVLERDGGVTVRGESPPETVAALRAAGAALARFMRRRGAYALPGSFTPSEPGSDIHYAGTLPVGGSGRFGCSAEGELNGVAGLFVADGASLPVLPVENCTLTLMANADRIGRALADRLG